MLAGSSPEFRTALERLTEVSRRYPAGLSLYGLILADVFFPQYEALDPSATESESTDRVMTFDPDEVPPSAFDAQFGLAYFE